MPWTQIYANNGIVDERGFYFQNSGWLSATGFRRGPAAEPELLAKIARAKAGNPRAFAHDRIGMVGYLTGPDRHIIDVFALNDPLLARLPANAPWRIGHFSRDLPAGYFESVVADRNLVQDPKIASLYEVIREVTRGPLWSWRRWRAIVALNLGRTAGWPVSSLTFFPAKGE
jgi:arabinofuranosyltransferase